MFRDPLYRQIRRRLRELKDGNAFEACANDLLRSIYPSLSPREGGDDAGVDGLIAGDGKSTIQLICTTGQNVLGNLTKSIKSNLKKGGKSHACILATSQKVTNPKKRILEERAQKLGRPLIQIYDQAGMAQLLYRDSRWSKELLGLAGNPPALSLFPITTRPLLDVPPVGRDSDLATFGTLQRDIVLVGQPGSGKTHLLFTVAKNFRGRFVVDEDVGLITEGVRDIQPRLLIIDDSHSRLELLKRLKLVRQQVGEEFRIVASCWPGQEDEVSAALGTARDKCHVLEELSQKQIKDVIESQKIFGPPHLVAEIMHQSQGKPGLAVTLCRLCWETGDARDVVLGTALARDVKLSFEPLLGEAATYLLACISIAGSSGLSLEAAARLTEKNVFEVKRAVEQLSAAGVLDIRTANAIVVQPMRLRQALVRDVFLKPPTIELTQYVKEAPDSAATTRVLIEAKAIGGTLSDDFLCQRLRELAATGEQTAFEEYAHLGKSEAEWVLDNYPEKLKAVAPAALHSSPEKTITLLLDHAAAHRAEWQPKRSVPLADKVIPEINSWVLSAKPNHAEAFKRREVLAISVEKWYARTQNRAVAIPASELVLSIKHEDRSSPPGEPLTLTFHFGLIAENQLSQIAALWPRVLPILSHAPSNQGDAIANMFHDWVFPSFQGGKNTPKEYQIESRSHARKMIADLLGAYAGNWTIHHKLRRYADTVGLGKAVRIEPLAEILFPSDVGDDWRKGERRQETAAKKLASDWCSKEPDSAVEALTKIESQAQSANISDPRWIWHVCCRIAETTNKLENWLASLFKHDAPAYVIEPFLNKLSQADRTAAEKWISKTFELPAHHWLGVSMVVKHCSPNTQLWATASRYFKDSSHQIGILVLRAEVRTENLKALLGFADSSVASATAVNLWQDRSTLQIPDEILVEWKDIVVEHVSEDHVLASIFEEHRDVAFRWIAKRLDEIRHGTKAFWFGCKHHRAVPKAIELLTQQQKRELIDKFSESPAVAELVPLLVGRDVELFRYLLSQQQLKHLRIDALRLDHDLGPRGHNTVPEFDEGWQQMALAALDTGYTAEDIFCVSQAGGYGWSGSMSSMYAARLAPFEKLRHHPDPRLQKVAEIGIEHYSKLKEQHLACEKRAAIRGELV